MRTLTDAEQARANVLIDEVDVRTQQVSVLMAEINGRTQELREIINNPQPLYRVRVLVDALNVRSGPAVTFPDVGDVFKNAELGVYEVAPSGWLRIHVTDAEWISGSAAYTVRL